MSLKKQLKKRAVRNSYSDPAKAKGGIGTALWKLDRRFLLAGVSALALLAASPQAHAVDILRSNPKASPVANVTAQQAAAMQQAQVAARRASNALARATQAIQAMQAAQNAARNLALQTQSAVPNGPVRARADS